MTDATTPPEPNAIYLDEKPISLDEVIAVLNSAPGLKQHEIVDVFYPGPRVQENGFAIYKPHLQVESHLRHLKAEGRAHFAPKGQAGGWRLR